LTHSIVKTKEITEAHQVEHYLQILRAMGWEAASRDPFLYLSKEGPAKAQDLLRSRGVGPEEMLVGLGPGAVFGDAKRWPADRFAIIGDWAVQRWGARVLVMGSQGETDICNAVRASMSRNALNLCGQTALDEAMAIVKRCHLFVTNDSGLMHVAAALGVPTVAIFGSTNPAATGPRGPQTAVVQHHVECAPCLKRRCPTDFRCLMSIPPEAVWAEMEKLRQKGASASNPSYPVEGVGDEETGRLH
jgi:heptosyltransferase-2